MGAYKFADICIKPGTSWNTVTMLVLITDIQRWKNTSSSFEEILSDSWFTSLAVMTAEIK
jgi:hypothetical protein